jgi:hypothetical protein
VNEVSFICRTSMVLPGAKRLLLSTILDAYDGETARK